jgi:hypothetical protein
MFHRLIIFLFIFFLSSFAYASETEIAEVVIKKSDLSPAVNELDLFMVNGMRQALTRSVISQNLDQEVFWKNIEAKNLVVKDEIALFKPLFITSDLLVNEAAPAAPVASASSTAPAKASDIFKRASFQFELNPELTKKFINQMMSNLPDVSLKTFYIVGEISLHPDLSWTDVGVVRKENFSGVILESWKKWVLENFKSYENIVILEKDFDQKFENMNSESVILKWNSQLRRSTFNSARKTAKFEVSAQYLLVNAKTNETLVAFDFPLQKRDVNVGDSKELSSTLASLVYNLLNSQTAKISAGLETNKNTGSLTSLEMTVTGQYGLSDIYLMNNVLREKFKEIQLSLSLKTYSSGSSIITLKSTATPERLYQFLALENGKFPLSEQKLLVFDPAAKSFAIIPNSQNN